MAEEKTALERRLALVKDLRDASIAVLALCYGAGYAVWAVRAYGLGVGFLPLLQAQYLVAGAPLVLILAVAVGLCLMAIRYFDWATRRRKGRPARLALTFVALAAALAAIVAAVIADERSGAGTFWTLALLMPALSIAATAVSVLVFGLFATTLDFQCMILMRIGQLSSLRPLAMVRRKQRRWVALLTKLCSLYAQPMAALALFVVFVQRVYPELPAEFGGMRPRVAALDVEREKLSSELAGLLGVGTGKERIVATRDVQIVFQSGEFLIVRPADASGKPIQIDAKMVQSVRYR